LIRRGVAPTACALYVESAPAAVSAKLIETTIKAAIGHAAGVVSPAVNLLIQGVLRAMLMNKLWTIAITVVTSLALATGAGVLARQAATLPVEDQLGGQPTQKKVGVENESGNTARSTANDLGESTEQENETIYRIELLRLDVELITGETRARMAGIQGLNKELIEVELRGKSDANGSQIESIKGRLRDARNEYLSKNMELNQKHSELIELEAKQRQEHNRRAAELAIKKRTGTDRRGATSKKPVATEPAASDAPGITPILENRLSAIEGKLDNVLKALEDLKSKIRQ
jgi:hypothetical protein